MSKDLGLGYTHLYCLKLVQRIHQHLSKGSCRWYAFTCAFTPSQSYALTLNLSNSKTDSVKMRYSKSRQQY